MNQRINLLKRYLLAFFGLIVIYTFFNWLIFVELELFTLHENIRNIALPILFSVILVWFVLKLKLKKFSLKTDQRSDPKMLFFLPFVLAIYIPTWLAQDFMETAMGKLTVLDSIAQIKTNPLTKYYKLRNKYFYNGQGDPCYFFDTYTSGKYNRNFNMELDVAVPMYANYKSFWKGEPIAWLGYRYQKSISNRLDPMDKRAEMKRFEAAALNEFMGQDIFDYVYLEQISTPGIKSAILKSGYQINGPILKAINEPFEERNDNHLFLLLIVSAIGFVVILLIIFMARIDEEQL